MLRKRMAVGSDIVHYCARCKLELGHRVLAMMGAEPARVRCNTCYSERNYKKARPLSGSERTQSSPKQRVAKTTGEIASLYQQKMKESFAKTAIPYRIDISAEAGDLIAHKVFGTGVVLKVIPPDRLEVLFKEELKVLACKVG